MAGPKADVIVRIAKSNSVFLRLCKQINAMQGTIDALLKQNAKLRKKVKRLEKPSVKVLPLSNIIKKTCKNARDHETAGHKKDGIVSVAEQHCNINASPVHELIETDDGTTFYNYSDLLYWAKASDGVITLYLRGEEPYGEMPIPADEAILWLKRLAKRKTSGIFSAIQDVRNACRIAHDIWTMPGVKDQIDLYERVVKYTAENFAASEKTAQEGEEV